MGFDVKDKRVTVAGAARSGLAAAELLARRGARVTLSDARAELLDADRLRSLGVVLELGGHTLETFTSADLIVLKARDYGEMLSRFQADRVVIRNGRAIDTTLPDYRELDDLVRISPSVA